MKQGLTRRLKPKPKHEKKSWQKRNEARKDKQAAFELQVTADQERRATLVDAADGLPVKTSDYYRDPGFDNPIANTETYFQAMMDIANED